ncbi:MAG: flagellar basal body P-ring protein FlgI [Verrucomicrobiota bacterium]|nr:flagellar basal body P-ring protein FlgI [Verrucomicrobiota bacterium]
MKKISFAICLIPTLAWSQAAIVTPPGISGANLMPISPLRANAVGGGVRIKDLSFIEGARANQLTGFGVVLGLNNTGDKDTVYSKQALANMLQQYGLTVPATSVSSKNAAAVMITANLPAFAKSGSKIDVNVMSMGDATSLTGGALIQTPLVGADGRVYAVAQGQVSNNSFKLGTDDASVTKNHPTSGSLIGGAFVEKEVQATLMRDGQISIILNATDFTLAARMAEAIRGQAQRLGGQGWFAAAKDGNSVQVHVPDQFRAAPIDFIAQLQAITVVPDSKARVVINERTGTIVATSRVKILSCAIAHGNIYLAVNRGKDAIQPGPLAQAGTTALVPADVAKVAEGGGGLNVFPEMPTVQEVSQALNSLGATPRDMMTIFHMLKAAEALQAELIIK